MKMVVDAIEMLSHAKTCLAWLKSRETVPTRQIYSSFSKLAIGIVSREAELQVPALGRLVDVTGIGRMQERRSGAATE